MVIYPNTNEFYKFMGKGLIREEIEVEGFYSWIAQKCMNLIRFLSMFNMAVPGKLLYGKWKNKKAETIILFEEVGEKKVIDLLEKNNPDSRKIYYLWNTETNKEKIDYARKHSWEIWSFDKKECKEQNFFFVDQFYPEIKRKKINLKYDIFFCGYNKGRAERLFQLEKIFENMDLKSRLIIREWGIQQYFESKKCYGAKYITFFETKYGKILEYIQESKCLLEILKDNQMGYSMRVMEAIFFEKKLITNNKEILNAEFYNVSNYFVVGYDNLSDLKKWLDVPYDDTNIKQYQERYSVKKWYEQLKIL